MLNHPRKAGREGMLLPCYEFTIFRGEGKIYAPTMYVCEILKFEWESQADEDED